MKVNGILPWFGSKRRLAPEIVRQLGPHKMYVEPFCGSMAVLFAKPYSSHDLVNDLHGNLINLAMVLASDKADVLFGRLYRTLDSEAIFDSCKKMFMATEQVRVPGSPHAVTFEHIERAYNYFVLCWIGRNGISGTARVNYQKARRWTPGGGSGAIRFKSAVESIPDWHERLRSVNIYNMNGFDLLNKIEDDSDTVLYVDPPYLQGGLRTSKSTNGKYWHEFVVEDHRTLAGFLSRFKKARVVLSYYADERLYELYPPVKWERKEIDIVKGLPAANQRGYDPQRVTEVLLVNGDLVETEEQDLFTEQMIRNDETQTNTTQED